MRAVGGDESDLMLSRLLILSKPQFLSAPLCLIEKECRFVVIYKYCDSYWKCAVSVQVLCLKDVFSTQHTIAVFMSVC